MILVRRIYSPAIGKTGELRSILEEMVRNYQAKGLRISLALKVIGDEGISITLNGLFENLEAFEKARDQVLSDPANREFGEKTTPLMSKPLGVEQYNTLVPPSDGNAPGRYVLRAYVYPALGKGPLIESIMTEFVKSRQAERPSSRLLAQLFGSQGQVFVFVDSFETLAEYENVAINNPSASLQAAAAQVNALSRAPIVQELYEVLIPFPS